MPLSLVAQYDDLIRCANVLADGGCEPEFLKFALNVQKMYQKWTSENVECERLLKELQDSNKVKSDLERKLCSARQMLDVEKKKRRSLEIKYKELQTQMTQVRELVWDDRNRLQDATREQLFSLCQTSNKPYCGSQFNNIQDLNLSDTSFNTTGSLLSELGYTRSEDELDVSNLRNRGWRKHRSSTHETCPVSGKRPCPKELQMDQLAVPEKMEVASSECLVATTTVTVPKDGPITAKSTIETVPSQEKLISPRKENLKPIVREIQHPPGLKKPKTESDESLICTHEMGDNNPKPFNSGMVLMSRENKNNRAHAFCQKTIIRGENCEPCGKRIKFGKVAAKCRNCRATVHLHCKEQLPLPCVPVFNTPTRCSQFGLIADYTPLVPPMVPALIQHCIQEVESRGLTEVGIYRVPGSEREVKTLKEKFLRGRGAPNLSDVDIHVICGTIKDFLRFLREPLITMSLWENFVKCVEPVEEADQQGQLYQVVADLPQPNRDTLAFVILHLQRVSQCPACKMPASNLAKIFGPTLVGYSTPDPDPLTMVNETRKQVAVVDLMIKTPSCYWSNFINIGHDGDEQGLPEKASPMGRHPSSTVIMRYGTPHSTPRSVSKRRFPL